MTSIANPYGNIGQPPERPAPSLVARVNVEGETVAEQANSVMQNVNKLLAEHADNAQRDEYLRNNAEAAQAHFDAFARSEPAKAVGEYERRYDERVEQLAANVDNVRRSLSPELDTAAELRASRSWERNRRSLDAVDDGKVVAAVQRAIESADKTELGILLDEFPSYLETRGLPTDFIEETAAKVAPELAKARAAFGKAQRAQARIKRNANAVRSGIASHRPATTIVPLGDDDPDR